MDFENLKQTFQDYRMHRSYDRFMAPLEKAFLRKHRKRLLSGITGKILEIGSGTGVNLLFYTSPEEVVLTEPSWPMCLQLVEKTGGRPFQILVCQADRLPFPAGCFDAAVSTLVLCSVPHPRRTLSEIHRVLGTRGLFLFLEHIRGEGLRALFQRLIRPLWKRLSSGCHPDRETIKYIELSGYRILETHIFDPSQLFSLKARILMQVALPFVRGCAEKTDGSFPASTTLKSPLEIDQNA